jgi:hypothetical protein
MPLPEASTKTTDVQTGRIMSAPEVAAYNAGIRVALAHARKAAEVLTLVPGFKPTRQGYAVAALEGFADAGTSLFLGRPATPPLNSKVA